MEDWAQKRCKPCEIGGIALEKAIVDGYMKNIKGWDLVEDKEIVKKFSFKDFKGAMHYVNKVAEIAEGEGHHPNIQISYNKVQISLTTHAVKGLSENDFIVAGKIDHIDLSL